MNSTESTATIQEIESAPSRALRPLSRRAQWLFVLVLALIATAAIGLGWGTRALGTRSDTGPASSTASATPPGQFRPTAVQLTSLRVASVATRVFRTERVTDGK